jgi:gas vesicle protein
MRGFSKTQVAGFFLTGAAVGTVVGLLFAPKSGTQTRRDIRKFSKRTVDQLDDLQSDICDQISESYGQVVDVIDSVREYVEDGKTRLRKMMKTA